MNHPICSGMTGIWAQIINPGFITATITSSYWPNRFGNLYHPDPKKVKLAPNGINPEEWITNKKKSDKKRPQEKVKAFFIGANYPPNIEAGKYIIRHLTAKCPDVQFIIAGGCCNPLQNLHQPNVKLLGKIRKKLMLLASMDIAINPMFSGGGVNLKTLEFLSAWRSIMAKIF